jgi:hypothetical protein
MGPSDTIGGAECTNCGAVVPLNLRFCPTCQSDAGAPNVRAARDPSNVTALAKRYKLSERNSNANGLQAEFHHLSSFILSESCVIVSVRPQVARALLESRTMLYKNYEQLVGDGQRTPSSEDADRRRASIGGMFFGSYAKDIIYGVLCLNKTGLATYGPIHCELRSKAIAWRTSFLESNSFSFVNEHGIVAGHPIPDGYTSDWENRHLLVMAKLGEHLSKGQTRQDWARLLVNSSGDDRSSDDFVESHIFGSFDRNAVAGFFCSDEGALDRHERMDWKIIKSLASKGNAAL